MNEELKILYQNHSEAKSKMIKGIIFLVVSEIVVSISLVACAFAPPMLIIGLFVALPFLCIGISFLVIGLKRMKKYNLLIEQKKTEAFTDNKENIVFEDALQENIDPLQNAQTIDNLKIEQLKKFKELLDSGIITEEEFNAKKKQLLGI